MNRSGLLGPQNSRKMQVPAAASTQSLSWWQGGPAGSCAGSARLLGPSALVSLLIQLCRVNPG